MNTFFPSFISIILFPTVSNKQVLHQEFTSVHAAYSIFHEWKERKLRVFENMVLRRIFGPRRDEVTGEWRKLHNEELNDLYSSPNIVRVINSRRMRWAGHVARMGEGRGCIGSWWGNRRERDTGET